MAKRKRVRPYRIDGRGVIYTWHIGEAADRLGITVEAARARLRSGKLKGFRAEGKWYVVVRHPYRRWSKKAKKSTNKWQRWI